MSANCPFERDWKAAQKGVQVAKYKVKLGKIPNLGFWPALPCMPANCPFERD
jgi:hypothetical protein